MRQKFTFNFLWILLIAVAISINFAFGFSQQFKTDTAYLRIKNAKANPHSSYLKNGFHLNFPAIKAFVSPASKVGMAKPPDDSKLLSNVTIFPNPVTDQINLKYTITRNTNVTIKVMDVLGNNVLTLLSQRMDPGEQKFSYNLNKQLTSGFYFVRVVVGTESVIKRISVL
ncbi:T9SS type A sorting domain-containing protein [Mucilaginibacter polytrichastri]|uniref:Secretion system C-terminal sorting domain-containing protein n=1 Tax=Mucilaginibacter polytrichastri TaxID=1302689 RepID=A0A1Q5ZTY7_9SPHI|nr:T9SS type A sorting domain-containing protein [Mucilaginibacter polytrichastri]OKS85230.1 hypothetical protein RG47T_0674 [Mucilaginibacter polytrichastri]SFS42363.1 Por secretion system C-terminal sorting domain-containing protein [Mucilaginibacter polytrichastri]